MKKKRTSLAGRRRVVFEVEAPVGSTVFLAGSFNDWDPTAKQLVDKAEDGIYKGICMLVPGRYEYKFVIDGEWTVDSRNPNFEVNAMGTLNSVIDVS